VNSSVDGLLVVDKPLGLTSHDVVAELRRELKTKKVGHAGTLDPQATGVLVLGIGKATRLLNYLVGLNKSYHAVIRLGQATSTEDAAGEVIASLGAPNLNTAQISEAVSAMVGPMSQTPPQVSAKKVRGKRAYDLARAGEKVELTPKDIEIYRFVLNSTNPASVGDLAVVDCDIDCEVSSGTYVRAMARDLGERLSVGGHILKLRRTRLGPWQEEDCIQLKQVAWPHVIPMGQVTRDFFQVRSLSQTEADLVRHGGRVPLGQVVASPLSINNEAVALLGLDGELLAMAKQQGDYLQPTTVFV